MTTNQINYQNMMERIRNDRALEEETNRHNRAIEDYNTGILRNQEVITAENARHNQAMEYIQQTQAWLQSESNRITARWNEMQYNLGLVRAAEEERTNRANELIRQTQNENTYQNYAWNYELGRGNLALQNAQLQETTRRNKAVERETQRHNLVTEQQGGTSNIIRGVGTAGELIARGVGLMIAAS